MLPVPFALNPALPANAVEIAARAKGYAEQAQAENTRTAYASDWAIFEAWCAAHGVQSLPADPGTVLAFLVDTAGTLTVSTQRRRLAAIKSRLRAFGVTLDTAAEPFRSVWKGIRRAHGRPPVKKAPLMPMQLRRALGAVPPGLAGVRDRALLLVGFAGGLRRNELAQLEVLARPGADWVEDGPDGLTVHLARSKGDQEGEGQVIGIPPGVHRSTCPVRAWRAWLDVSGINAGPAFRSIDRHGRMGEDPLCAHSIALIVKRAAIAGELANGATQADAEAAAKKFAGHSLRRGLATSAARNKAPGHLIQKQLRHRKYDTTAGYIEEAQLHDENAASYAGL
ncbi:tyrosine-type recombinase/integrase [Bradyrhizobium canariense]|uniref:Tyr recombinase domain-containing protein n=1 Tax=Bradyrhizobium canariense TaxID=255045 RepID=A0A1X3GJJ4_9BRAD|nr:tyrosine-type recombinase/integrase [Bradyrhizobium canariense]OSI79409.1 hypothetical protein BSZ23_15105 [Bradyrhizobium canariense]OSI89593.1 hypothetical protein BSZ25_20295 [Bradyrhizobium canariense]OSI91029.1 hypothetical protein BSZ24_18910 [Bradyrhizobium canariense]OSJ03959.1 hypothetical protein BSZ16_14730 [Bradyrhizobium canariense]OSJ12433.1 hypothetical protein BSZ18_12970 [Bradyrhizobium canariense]